jgi:hypothetical protein
MAQCSKYPNGCRGHVRLDKVDETWYCEKHFYEYDHMEVTDRKMKTREKPRILNERAQRAISRRANLGQGNN